MDEYCGTAGRALAARDYTELSNLLSLYTGKQLLVRLQRDLLAAPLSRLVSSVAIIPDDLWREVLLNHLRAVKGLSHASNRRDTFGYQLDVLQVFLRDIFGKADRGMLPVLYVLCRDLWGSAIRCQEEECEEEAARTINKAFTACVTDRSSLEMSRKHGCFKVLSLLMTIYFHRNQLNLCVQLLRAIKSADLPKIPNFPKSHTAPYHYYHGRFLAVSEKYDEACAELRSALVSTYSFYVVSNGSGASNIQKILLFYIPVHLTCYPHCKPSLVGSFMPKHFADALSYLSHGDAVGYRAFLSDNFEWFAKHELFCHFQRFEIIAIRNAVRRIHFSLEPSKRTKIPLQLIYTLFKGDILWPLGLEHLAGHMSSIIAAGAIRGYISMTPPYLVLSGKEPFPPYSLANSS